ncbi:DUF2242 domain-containing protein [Burkholderia guangdongensis]|uniref:DUF2242 domain-containing protein n=1 Tax=Burkholderia guangdongensis TaxID=1792500 RepID=UPI0015C7FA62|nr:DUF2242 domain-containing protein [Burkholderia guangdongensis]
MPYRLRLFPVSCALTLATLLTACSSTSTQPLYQQEQFDAAASPYARTFHAKSDATCEAARRALLSQGYVSTSIRPDAIDGSKNFQPSNDSHVVIEFHVVCADADTDGASSIAYVNAVEDRYALKKSNTSASVGLSVFGSLSLPIGSSDDAMVKIASETIPAGVFYERFFNLVDHFLKVDPTRRDRATVKAAEKEKVAPLPEPAPTHQGEPLKLTTPVAPTPPAPPMPVAVPTAMPAAQQTPAAAPSPASAALPASAPSPASTPSQTPGATTPAALPASSAAPAAPASATFAPPPAATSASAPTSTSPSTSPTQSTKTPAAAPAPASASSSSGASAGGTN